MDGNYTVINGGNNPFDRVAEGEEYYSIGGGGSIISYTENTDSYDNNAYCESNYFNDIDFAHQVNLHQLLYRKLLKFAYDNECEDTAEWDGNNHHWVIQYCVCGVFTALYKTLYKAQEVYFSSEEDAERAIEEVVDPFMKEHPDFVW